MTSLTQQQCLFYRPLQPPQQPSKIEIENKLRIARLAIAPPCQYKAASPSACMPWA